MKNREVAEPMDPVASILERMDQTPDAPALTGESGTWTYAELGKYARRVERCLRASGGGAQDAVVVQGSRSPQTVATLLGVLLTDATYVAIGDDLPDSRLRHVLEQTSPRLVLTEEPERFHGAEAKVLTPQDWAQGEPADEGRPDRAMRGDTPAYIVFTSGTTGTPKGVVIARRSLAQHSEAVRHVFGLRGDDRVLQASSLAFDVSAEEIWPTLATGACVTLLPGRLGEVSFDQLTRLVVEQGITVCNLPASYFSGWAAHLDAHGTELPALRLVVTGSEELPVDVARNWCSTPGRPRLIHAYGVSEATITSVTCELTPELTTGERAPLGAPLSGVRTVVVDERGERVRPGADGELLIGGPGVAIGYCGDTPRPQHRFVEGPIADAGEGPWYRTGDRVREEHGLLYYLGRLDDQVKINGVRVEPGEIAAVLVGHQQLTDAKVLKIGENLVGCVCAAEPIDQDTLLGELRAVLPPVMVPVAIVRWDAFPLTDGGKVDVPALRATAAERLSGSLATPVGSAEVRHVVRRLWQNLLGASDVGPHADFFALGGDSLAATRLSSAVLRETGLAVGVKSVFSHPRFDDYLAHVQSMSTRSA
ncbi:non-ribosomal peptide synthetase [Streptomyces sp. HD]|uniref:non-ribosomal peptide synthetase n=1 Tax=Streptomyces sp. HD TaxID=3020892 RepID=UPI00232E5057|nr:non-ribosomal peptide synthetase [Streptomyces sp. HD]MDC0773369.1 non-ribosomal peptide synthetase [Streptomyces sp. HD]